MEHLSEDSLYRLAELVTDDLPFDDDDVTKMAHVGQCEQCYEKLQEYRVVMDMVSNIGILTYQSAQLRDDAKPVCIQIVISPVLTMLEQLVSHTSERTYEQAFQSGNVRGEQNSPTTARLENIDNPKSYIAYDPVKMLLTIQIDAATRTEAPQAQLELPDGSSRLLSFEKHGSVFIAQLSLPDGTYRLHLES